MLTLLYVFVSFAYGFIGAIIFNKHKPKEKLINATVPVATLLAEFEEFARNIEGGELSIEADAILKMIKNRVEQKKLSNGKSKKNTWDGSKREDEWSDLRCFEKEIKNATSDDERICIVANYMEEYLFARMWQTWCINSMATSDAREKLREMFANQ